MINYDLPWNPMRVEQRIGRIDRIGQEYDDVFILNYSYEDTVESDIYDRLGDRIGLFEYVVGDMQPILSSVGSKIREATMEQGAKTGSKEYEQLQGDIERDIDEQQGEEDAVELKDSLSDLDSTRPLREQVIQEARLDAWETYSHPDLGKVGIADDDHDPVFSADAVKTIFLNSDLLEEVGIRFNSLTDLDEEFDLGESQDAESIYCLHCPEEAPVSVASDEESLEASIFDKYGAVGVTFDSEVADEYTSLRFLAPGSPLFYWLSSKLVEESEHLNLNQFNYRVDADGGTVEVSEKPWTVTGWAKEANPDSQLVSLSGDGSVAENSETTDLLRDWVEEFDENRTHSNS
jgi:hypothetical protein